MVFLVEVNSLLLEAICRIGVYNPLDSLDVVTRLRAESQVVGNYRAPIVFKASDIDVLESAQVTLKSL